MCTFSLAVVIYFDGSGQLKAQCLKRSKCGSRCLASFEKILSVTFHRLFWDNRPIDGDNDEVNVADFSFFSAYSYDIIRNSILSPPEPSNVFDRKLSSRGIFRTFA